VDVKKARSLDITGLAGLCWTALDVHLVAVLGSNRFH
jgi:hypothetical protein